MMLRPVLVDECNLEVSEAPHFHPLLQHPKRKKNTLFIYLSTNNLSIVLHLEDYLDVRSFLFLEEE